jgi:hypothetical protein
MMKMKEIDYRIIPEGWAMCQKSECQKAGECLRFQACLALPATIKFWKCLLPQVVKGDECRFFVKMEPVRMARGLNRLYKEVRDAHVRHELRMTLTEHFGSKGSYYRYKNGERWLSPQHQQTVLEIVRRCGCESEVVFDEYADTYDFTTSV